ncbi:hypothetical protein [Streptomyces sp. N50]|uniref:hypothetical protein n=1 Tax=Streptomyces sp. N50 TaxID=3081765 RepID=UPI0029620882|nr:hypothetical protein [Streptomyces sp. N50]WOX11327.1 hypothetical protein R2B38_21980 [Streptomyces sp. N50]
MSDRPEGNGSRERREPDVRRGPTWARKDPPNETHAGNGTVNHGPDEQSPTGPSLDGQHPGGDTPENPENHENPGGTPDRDTPDGDSLEGFDSDELALRRLLHQAVQEVEPRDGTLDHLRKAVPARRARKRQALVGMAATVLFFGTAIPALVHVSNSTGSDADPSIMGNSSQAQGGTSQGKGPDGGSSTSGGTSGRASQNPGGHKNDGTGKTPGRGTVSANPSASAGTAESVCTAEQLGASNSTVDAADAAGVVYGTFSVTNTSGTSCTVSGPGTVGTYAIGAADSTKINVAQHSSGDAAAGLPDPSTEVSQLVLQAGASYVVKFAWVPSETCPTTGTSTGGTTTGGSTPTPTPTEDASTSSGSTTGDTGTSTQLLRTDGTLDGSVQVSHTAEAGSPTVTATVPNACAGTVYRTGLLAGS